MTGHTDVDAALARFATLDEQELSEPWWFRDKPSDVRSALYRTLEDAQEAVVRLAALVLHAFLLATFVYQLLEEGAKWLLGHKRPLRRRRFRRTDHGWRGTGTGEVQGEQRAAGHRPRRRRCRRRPPRPRACVLGRRRCVCYLHVRLDRRTQGGRRAAARRLAAGMRHRLRAARRR